MGSRVQHSDAVVRRHRGGGAPWLPAGGAPAGVVLAHTAWRHQDRQPGELYLGIPIQNKLVDTVCQILGKAPASGTSPAPDAFNQTSSSHVKQGSEK